MIIIVPLLLCTNKYVSSQLDQISQIIIPIVKKKIKITTLYFFKHLQICQFIIRNNFSGIITFKFPFDSSLFFSNEFPIYANN